MSTDPDWVPATEDEVAELAPYTLQCQGLSDEQVATVKAKHLSILKRALFFAARELGRVPEQAEVEMIARAVVSKLNADVIPLLREQAGEAMH